MTFLIIENSLPMRRVIRSFISDFNADICECLDAAEALNLYHLTPQWVLLNLEIKNTDGITDILQLKKKWSKAKIVAVSEFDEIELREAAFAAGACEYIIKENLIDLRRLFTN